MFFYTVMKTPIVYLLFMIVLYLSCSPRPQSPADIHTDLSNNKILQLSELFDRIRYNRILANSKELYNKFR